MFTLLCVAVLALSVCLVKGLIMTEFEKIVDSCGSGPYFKGAYLDVNESVEIAKKILLNNKVQNFTAADVVALTDIIIQRQQYNEKIAR